MSSLGSGIPIFKMKLAETGKVRDIKKIIARIEGLPSCLNGQIVDFGEGVRGIVMGFDEDDVRVLVLGDETKLRMGMEVTGINEPFTIPVGEKFLGRMVDALGDVCDSGGPITPNDNFPVFRDSPTITDRSPVDQFMQTGTKIVDAFVPIGKGQRQLIVGDRMTGKTVVAIDAIANQKGRDVVCIYCCIGKSMSALEKVVSVFQEAGALEYTIIMIALDNAPVGEQYIVPYSAASMADYFMQKGRDVLVVFDDLTKHAWAYRQLSLLLERPPGREAYPGDIFYIHTQLMERAGRMSESKGGGSMTFLGLTETLEGDLTGYIPSNLISMCDGLVFLSNTLFSEGMRPAIDVAQSVSIVGVKAQPAAIRAMASALRVQYAHYLEVEKLSKLQSTLSDEAAAVMKRGEALASILSQDQFLPVPFAEEVLLLRAVYSGRLDELTPAQREAFSRELMAFCQENNPSILEEIEMRQELSEEMTRVTDELLDAFIVTLTEAAASDETQEGAEAPEAGEAGPASDEGVGEEDAEQSN